MNHRLILVPCLAATVAVSACAPTKGLVTQILSNPTNLVNTVTQLSKLVNKYGGKLSSISTKGVNGLLSPSDFKELETLIEGAKTGKLPLDPGFTTLTVTETKKPSPFGVLSATSFNTLAGATEQDQVGTGGNSPAEEVVSDEANPKLEGETAVLESSSEDPHSSHYGLLDVAAMVDLRPQMPPIRNQGHRGTCVLFSTAGYLDYLYASDPNSPIKHASPEFMNWSYNVMIKSEITKFRPELWQDLGSMHALYHTILREGGMADVVPDKWPFVPARSGYISEEEVPYQPNETYDDASADYREMALKRLGADIVAKMEAKKSFTAQGARFFKLKHDLATFKSVLSASQPIQTSVPIYDKDWSNLSADTNFQIPEFTDDKAADKANVGYHSVLLVGYKDDANAPGGGWFTVRNSWGDGWGDSGYAYLSYDFMVNYGGQSFAAEPYAAPFQATYTVTPPDQSGAAPPTSCDTNPDGADCQPSPTVALDSIPSPPVVVVAPD